MTIALPIEQVRQLEEAAHTENRSASEVVDELVRQYIARRHDEMIALEAAQFRAQHAALWQNYAGQFVAMRAGQVLDHDADVSALRQRVRGQFGTAPILIAPVLAEAEPEFRVRRPTEVDDEQP